MWIRLCLGLAFLAVSVFGDRKRDSSTDTITSTSNPESVSSETEAMVSTNGPSTNGTFSENKTVSKEPPKVRPTRKPTTRPTPRSKPHHPRSHDASTRRGNTSHSKPKYQTNGWRKNVLVSGNRRFPASFNGNGRWWHYQGSLNSGRQVWTRYRFDNRH